MPRLGLLFGLVLPTLLANSARAFPIYPPLLPNRAYAFSSNENAQRPCITCHNNPDGGQGCICPLGHGCDVKPVDPALHTAPCFNPFGQAFSNNGKVWNATLAALDSDGDGFTNGQELQDPLGAWVYLASDPEPGNKNYVTRPGFPDDTPGLSGRDSDMDRVCWFGRDLNNDGDCSDPGENTADRDCDDSDMSTNSFAAELCTDVKDNNCDGLSTVADPTCNQVVDNDGDGFCETGRDLNNDDNCLGAGEPSSVQIDCDDTRANVYFDAPENCVDGLDNDCDQLVDQDDPECDPNDGDHDGYCPLGRDLSDPKDGDCSDPGEQLNVSDCNDDSAAIHPGATEVCNDSADNDCDGNPDFLDSECRHLADSDADGFCPEGQDLDGDGNCADTGENNGKEDCDDTLATRNPGEEEQCMEVDLDADCDGQADLDDPDCVGYLDQDGDGFCPMGQDFNDNGSCIDKAGVLAVNEYTTGHVDCDDTSEFAKFAFPRNGNEEALADGSGCFDGLDTDCDGFVDGKDSDCSPYSDHDGDGYCALGTDLSDPKDGDCTDPGETSETPLDCADDDRTFGPQVQENCVDAADNNCNGLIDEEDPQCVSNVDVDADGFCPRGTDLNKDGNCQGPGENRGNDCNDDDPTVNSSAAENTVVLCTDWLDNDCDGKTDQKSPSCGDFIDNDRDTFCERGKDLNFNATCLDASEQTAAMDCDDTTKAAFPGRREICDDGLDNDCNGKKDGFDTAVCKCTSDDQCKTDDPCQMGVCRSMACQVVDLCEEPTPMGDAGPMKPVDDMDDEPDAGMAPPAAKPPKTPDCSAGTTPSERGFGWLLVCALGLAMTWGRRRSRG